MVKWMSDQFRWGTLAASAVLVLVIIYLRFCGSLSLPAKPPPPTGPAGTQRELMSRSSASPAVYKGFLESDAENAGAPVPSLADMAKKLSYRVDEARHVLDPGEPPIEVAGLRLHLERTGSSVIMVIENKLDSAVGYNVVSAASSGSSLCMSASPLPYNAMTISKGASERRTECKWRDGMSIIVTKVETLELLPLEAWYLGQVPPLQVGIEERLARGHHGVQTSEKCSPVMSSSVRAGLERGTIGWRDLADFYARHRCQTYQFPTSYRALKSDGERSIPAVD
jgi:hypothetical protein